MLWSKERICRCNLSAYRSCSSEQQKVLLEKALGIFQTLELKKDKKEEDPTWKNTWNWNLCDANFGHLVLDIKEGRVSAELTSQGALHPLAYDT